MEFLKQVFLQLIAHPVTSKHCEESKKNRKMLST